MPSKKLRSIASFSTACIQTEKAIVKAFKTASSLAAVSAKSRPAETENEY